MRQGFSLFKSGTGLILTILFLFQITEAQESITFSGRVLDIKGAVIVGAKVEFRELTSRIKNVSITDGNGEFRYLRLKEGTYQITVTADNFENNLQKLEIKQTNSLEIVLQPKSLAEVVSVNSSYLAGSAEVLERTAGSFQTVERETLENSRVFNFSEALRKISGVNVRDEEGFGLRPNISIRGTNPTRSTKVLLLEDGIPLSYAPYGENAAYYHPPIERFEAIEVLKGSGQIEYGPVTVAGVVNYLTPNPTEEPTFSLKLIGGNRSYFNGSLGFSDTFGQTGLIVNFTRKQGAGARENISSGLNDFSSKIIQQLNGKNILTGKFSWYGEDSNVTYSGSTEDEYRQNPRSNPFRNDFFYANRFGTSLSHTAVFTSKSSLTTNLYVNNFSRHWWRQSSNSDERPNALGRDSDCRGMQDLNTTCGNIGRLRNYWVVGVEPRLNVQFELGKIRNEFSAGFRFQNEDQNRIQKNGDLPNSRDGRVAEDNERKVNALAGFVQNRFIWKLFSITPGVRIENIRYDRTNRLGNNGNGISGKTQLTEIIPGLGFAYNAFGKLTFFAGVHRGFAPPAVADIISNSGGVVELDSELSWNYEVGLRTRPVNGIRLEGTYFRTDYSNQIVPQSVAGGIGSTVTNGGETFHQGFEFFSRFDSAEFFKTTYNFYFQTNYTLLETAEFRGTRFSSVNGFTNISVAGNRLPYTPKNLLNSSIGLAYRNFDGFFETNYIGRQYSDDLNRINPTPNGQAGLIPSQIYFTATANYQVEGWKSTFFITAKNISDRVFIVDRSRGILPGSPRLIQLGWKWRFGN